MATKVANCLYHILLKTNCLFLTSFYMIDPSIFFSHNLLKNDSSIISQSSCDRLFIVQSYFLTVFLRQAVLWMFNNLFSQSFHCSCFTSLFFSFLMIRSLFSQCFYSMMINFLTTWFQFVRKAFLFLLYIILTITFFSRVCTVCIRMCESYIRYSIVLSTVVVG